MALRPGLIRVAVRGHDEARVHVREHDLVPLAGAAAEVRTQRFACVTFDPSQLLCLRGEIVPRRRGALEFLDPGDSRGVNSYYTKSGRFSAARIEFNNNNIK